MQTYDGDIYDVAGYDRSFMKKVLLIAINSSRSNGKSPYQGAIQAIQSNVSPDYKIPYCDAKDALDAFIEKHKSIENFICSDFGVTAMYHDGLIIEDCLRELVLNSGIIVLPVHDELLCPSECVDFVKNQMIQSYRKVLKQVLVKNGKLKKSEQLPVEFVPLIKQG